MLVHDTIPSPFAGRVTRSHGLKRYISRTRFALEFTQRASAHQRAGAVLDALRFVFKQGNRNGRHLPATP